MPRTVRIFLIASAWVALTFANIDTQARPDQLDRGGDWLSWSPREGATFVDGYISGYLRGSQTACEVAEQLFGKAGTLYRLGDEHHPGEIPSARCLARMDASSRQKYVEGAGPDFTAYPDVITEFYTRHPEYLGVPFVDLMISLSDRNRKTADQLYQMAAKGELRPIR